MTSIHGIYRVLAYGAALGAILCVVVLPSGAQEERPRRPPGDYNYLLPWDKKGVRVPATKEAQSRAPFQIFDNLYYVGPKGSSTYLLKTDKGLILIDPAYDYTAETVLDNVRKLGMNPADIKYILVSHGHWDHSAGVKIMQKVSDARVGMTAGDWDIYEKPVAEHPYETIPRDLVLKQGDEIQLGNTTVKMHVTPGHTPGCLSMEYTVYDKGKPYKALTLGGLGFNFSSDWTQRYIESLKRMRSVPNVQVLLPDHPQVNDVFELEQKLKMRKPGEPNPFIQSREAILGWFDEVLKAAEEKNRLEVAAKNSKATDQ